LEYWRSSNEAPDISFDEFFSEQCKENISRNILSMLALTPSSRPSAVDLETEFVKNFSSNQALPHPAVCVHRDFHQVEATSMDGTK